NDRPRSSKVPLSKRRVKRKVLIASTLLIFGAGIWLLASLSWNRRPGANIPVTLVAFTNSVTDIPTASYSSTNVAYSSYAVFRIQNPTRRDFFCYIGPIFFRDGQIDLRSPPSGDFDLPPGATATFAVPAPDIPSAWQCGVVLCHKRQYSRLQFALIKFA